MSVMFLSQVLYVYCNIWSRKLRPITIVHILYVVVYGGCSLELILYAWPQNSGLKCTFWMCERRLSKPQKAKCTVIQFFREMETKLFIQIQMNDIFLCLRLHSQKSSSRRAAIFIMVRAMIRAFVWLRFSIDNNRHRCYTALALGPPAT